MYSNKTTVQKHIIDLLYCLFKWEKKAKTIKKDKTAIEDNPGKEYNQDLLTPTYIKKEDPSYKTVNFLAAQLNNKEARNIAITGPYGSGKSSVLRTLKKDYPNHHYLNISLATLKCYEDQIETEEEKEESKKPSTPKTTSHDDSPDSGSIDTHRSEHDETQQNDHSQNHKPVSRESLNRLIEDSILQQLLYKEKNETIPHSRIKRIVHTPHKQLRWTAIKIMLFAASLIILFEPRFIRIEWLYRFLSSEWLNVACDVLALWFIIYSIYKVLVLLSRTIANSKLSKLNLAKAEIEFSKDGSIFNQHLDEIFYFFEATEYTVIIFEDLDRFDNVDIFIKLREINTLLNESKRFEKEIVFIYAIRDDLFSNTDRCKCFDYIVPIIPFINPYNSKDMLKNELELRGYKDISDEDLKNLSFYIFDMRLVKNIANEYQQYREILKACLQKNERKDLPSFIKQEKLLAMIILKNLYPKEFSDLHYYKGKIYKCFKLRKAFVEKLSFKIEADIQQLTKELSDKIQDRPSNGLSISKIKTDRKKQVLKFQKIKFSPFKNLMTEINLEQDQSYKALKIEPMIESLLKEGYIDENYYDYISFFHGRMISPHDWAFVLDLKNGKNPYYDYSFDNIKSCIDEINIRLYSTKSILNFDILNYWIEIYKKKKESYRDCEKTKKHIEYITNTAIEDTSTWDFFVLYYQKGRYSDLFFRDFCSEIFCKIWNAIEYYNEKYRNILIEIFFRYTELELIDYSPIDWLNENYSFLADRLNVISLDRAKYLIDHENCCIYKLQKEPTELLDYMIKTEKYATDDDHNISVINSYLGIDTFKKDSKEFILAILQNDKLEKKTKFDYLEDQKNSIELSDISNLEHQTLAIKLFIISPTWDQVYRYYELMNNTVTKELTDFITHFVHELTKSPLPRDESIKVSLKALIITSTLPQKVKLRLMSVF